MTQLVREEGKSQSRARSLTSVSRRPVRVPCFAFLIWKHPRPGFQKGRTKGRWCSARRLRFPNEGRGHSQPPNVRCWGQSGHYSKMPRYLLLTQKVDLDHRFDYVERFYNPKRRHCQVERDA
jgi:hypothetical protein